MKSFFKKLGCLSLAALMLITAFTACGKKEESNQTESEEATEAKNPLLEAAFSETSFVFVDGSPAITYVTYNGYNNPICEKAIGIMEIGEEIVTEYEYDDSGKLVKVIANLYDYASGNGEATLYYSVEYAADGSAKVYTDKSGEPNDEYTSVVEYHDNGVIKKWSIVSTADETQAIMSMEQDSDARRTLFAEMEEKITYTYSNDGREITDCTFAEGNESIKVPIEYTDKLISKITLDASATSNDRYSFDFEHSKDGKGISKVIMNSYEDNLLCDKYLLEYAYGESGRYSSIGFTEYENDAVAYKEVLEYTYNSDNRMTKKVDTEYDESGNKTGYSVVEFEYDSKGDNTKKINKSYNSDGSFKSHYESIYEYDSKGYQSKYESYSYNEDGSVKSRSVNTTDREYDSNGKLSKMTYTNTEYDSQGKITDKYQYSNEYLNGNLVKKTQMEYDNDGNVNGKQVYEYEYDANGKRIKQKLTAYDAQGNVIEQSETTY